MYFLSRGAIGPVLRPVRLPTSSLSRFNRTIKTFVFMKAKTTGIYPRELEPRKNQDVMNKPMPSDVYRQELLRYMNDCQSFLYRLPHGLLTGDLTQLPRMAALAFLSVPRDVFTNSMNTMQKKFDNEVKVLFHK